MSVLFVCLRVRGCGRGAGGCGGVRGGARGCGGVRGAAAGAGGVRHFWPPLPPAMPNAERVQWTIRMAIEAIVANTSI